MNLIRQIGILVFTAIIPGTIYVPGPLSLLPSLMLPTLRGSEGEGARLDRENRRGFSSPRLSVFSSSVNVYIS